MTTPESQQAALERHARVTADLIFYSSRYLLIGRKKMSRKDRKRVNRLKCELKELTNDR